MRSRALRRAKDSLMAPRRGPPREAGTASGHADTPMNAHPTSPPMSGTATRAGVKAGASSALRTEQEMTSMGHDGSEDDGHAHQGDGRCPAETHLELGAEHVEFAHKQTERREAQKRKQSEPEDATEDGAAAEQGRHALDLAGAFGREDLTRRQEQHPLGQAVAEDVEENGGDRQRRAGRRPEGDQTHVLDAVSTRACACSRAVLSSSDAATTRTTAGRR